MYLQMNIDWSQKDKTNVIFKLERLMNNLYNITGVYDEANQVYRTISTQSYEMSINLKSDYFEYINEFLMNLFFITSSSIFNLSKIQHVKFLLNQLRRWTLGSA